MTQEPKIIIGSLTNEQSPLTNDEDANESSHIEMVFRTKKISANDDVDDTLDKSFDENGTSENKLREDQRAENTKKCCHTPKVMKPCCPPRGHFGYLITKGVLGFVIWAALWSILGKEALPGGNMFSLFILLVVASLAGFLVSKIPFVTFPPLLGMLIAGFLLRNVPGISVAKDIDKQWSSTLRNVALVIILLRSGLGLDIQALKRLKCTVLRLAFCPCLVEAITVAIFSHFLLGMPWLWAFMLGYET